MDNDDYSGGPESVLTDAGFDEDQAAALVEAMRMCIDETGAPPQSAPSSAPPKKGVDLAIVFGGKRKK